MRNRAETKRPVQNDVARLQQPALDVVLQPDTAQGKPMEMGRQKRLLIMHVTCRCSLSFA